MSPDPTDSPDPAEPIDPRVPPDAAVPSDARSLAEALADEADAADAAGRRPVDLEAVLRGSRALRRRRRRAVVGVTASVAGLLVVGALALGVGSLGERTATTAGSTAADGPAESEAELGDDAASGQQEAVAPQDGAQFGDDALVVGPDAVNRCGERIASATDAADGPLTAAIVAPTGPVASGSDAVVRVRIVNEGPTVVEGSLRSAPSVTVSDDGTTVWHPAALDAGLVPVRLAPGGQLELEGAFTAEACTAADEQDGALAADLPALSPGAYELSAAIGFVGATGSSPVLIVSPTVPVTIG
ncbi:hypothetical protein [Agromyces sp. PvR057]|uniref:hypothetical protein n=1 Tax=Agromyces sp. PvR057 TaxID=3156403 RepID=UPI00339B1AEF